MNRPYRSTLALFAALILFGNAALGDAEKEKPKVKFEIRLAQKEAAEGLEEMVVPQSKNKIYVHKGAVLTNADVAVVKAHTNERNQEVVNVDFVEGSRKKVGEFSEKNIGKIAAIFIDGKLVVAPVIRAKFSDTVVIAGDFSREEAERIARALNGK
jgi:preprotein translocase subunit SecD